MQSLLQNLPCWFSFAEPLTCNRAIQKNKSSRWLFGTFVFVIFSTAILYGGAIRGVVRTKDTHEFIVGGNVSLPGTGMGAVTNTSGEFFISMFAGSYTIRVSMLGYDHYEKKDVVVPNDTSEVFLEIYLKDSPLGVGEVVVRARANRELEAAGVRTEFEANNIINVVTAQTIERSTDRTATEVLQRVSGLSIVKQNGEGHAVVMRGLTQQYNNTLVDGIKIPSPESKDRFIPLDIFPSSLFERIDVTKALTADLPGDAIGGTTDLVIRRAPESFILQVSAATGYNSSVQNNPFMAFDASTVQELDPDRLHHIVDQENPTAFTKDAYGRLTVSPSDFSVNNLKFTYKNSPIDGLYSLVVGDRFLNSQIGIIASGGYQNTYNRSQTNVYGIDGGNINNSWNATNASVDDQTYYSHKMRGGATIKTDFILDVDQQFVATFIYNNQTTELTRNGISTTLNGTVGSATIVGTYRSALQKQTIANYSISGDNFTSSPISVHWILNYSDAQQDRPDDAQYSLLNHPDRNGNIPSVWGTGNVSHSWRWNDDRQYLANVDFTYKMTSDETHVIHTGGGYTGLKRANFQNDFSLVPALDPTTGRTPPFTEIDSMKFVPNAAIVGNPVFNYQNYKAQEALLSGYFEYTLNTGAFQALAGIRWEQATDQFWTAAPISDRYNSDTVKFIDLLPSAHIRYAFSPEHILRLSVTKTMSRPSYFDLVPAQDVGDVNVNKGNPDLKAAHSTNIDLQYEYVTSTTDQFSVTFYKKHITDAIQKSVSGSTVSSTTMSNGPPADVYGAEGSAVVHFGNFGISGNYAQVYSATTDQVTIVTIGTDMWGELGPVNTLVTRTRPLQDQSRVLANATLSYGNKQWGTGMQISYNYTGRRLVGVGSQDGLDVYENGVGDMDFSADQIILPGLKLSIKLSNILNSVVVREAPSGAWMMHARLLVEQDYNKFRGTIGISYRL
jgi:hypothetical protein